MKLFEKFFFRGCPLNGKNFDEKFVTEAESVVNVDLGTARGNVEQDSLSDFCCMLNKRIIMEKLWRAIKKIDRNKGFDPYNWQPFVFFNFFPVSSFSL